MTVREFSYNPSAVFARVEHGETIQVTGHGSVIAVLLPASGALDRYSSLIAKVLVRLKGRPPTISTASRGMRCRRAPAVGVRTLDAVHVASAQVLDDALELLVTYDKRMYDVAVSIGRPVAPPGLTPTT